MLLVNLYNGGKKIYSHLLNSLPKLLIIIVSLILVINSSSYSGVKFESNRSTTTSKRLTYTIDKYKINTVNINGKQYNTINMDKGIAYTLEKGKPQLPIISTDIMTSGCNSVKIKIVSIKYKTISSLPILPSKGNLTRNIDPSTVALIEGDIYTRNTYFPESSITASSPFMIRSIQGVALRITPFSYNGAKKELRIAEQIVFTVEEIGSSRQTVTNKNIPPEFDDIYKTRFINYGSNTRYTSVNDGDKMIIITTSEYKVAAETLAEWKNRKGIQTNIYTYPTETGGTGEASVKSFIQGKYDSDNISYVILIGDWEDIPSKMVTYGTETVSSDPAYIMLSGGDKYADAFVGRISVETLEQANAFVNKVITYEKMPEVGGVWYKKAVSIGTSEGTPKDHEWLSDSVKPELSGYTYTSIDEIYQDIGGTTTDFSNYLNSGRGLVNFMGHGNNDGFGFKSGFWYGQSLINGLSNGDKLPVIIPLACNIGQFKGRTCASEAWIRNPDGGAIAIMGSSPLMDWIPPQAALVEMNRLIVTEKHLSMGAYFFNGEMEMLDNGSSGEKSMDTWNYFGDPSLQFFTDAPKQLTLTHPTSTSGSFQVSGPVGTIVCIYSPSESKMVVKEITASSVTFDLSGFSGDKIYVTGIKRNYAPHLGEISSGPSIAVTTPNGGEKINTESNYEIKWSASTKGKVSIYLYKGATKVKTIATNIDNSGSYTWAVSKDLVDGTDYKIELSDGSLSDKSDANFTVGKDVVVTYTLSVINGSGSGDYGESVVISITAKDSTGYDFISWTGDIANLSSTTSKTVDVTMAAKEISVTATYVKADGGYILMPKGTGNIITVRDSLFYDSEGADSNYLTNFTGELTLKPSIAGKMVKIEFLEFDIEKESSGQIWDTLIIYNGSDKSELKGVWCGTNSPGIILSTAKDGSLTIKFNSDDSDVSAGWKAHITLVGPVSIIAGILVPKAFAINIVGNRLNFQLPTTKNEKISSITIDLYALNGAKIATYNDDLKMGRSYSVPINSIAKNGLAIGIYIVRVKGDNMLFNRKLMVR